ncbi:hypothetical protein AVEN_82231-1 [Araneus ventricosus]|uniref:Uncharacterized protein n=1 Tax=Araneus ventricosus TaxID=182803 RepID=A0A4Y2VEW2_ARAVE|nr:hypothetical protein AVEN_91623-1 [Araneus ventricosus]GBO22277.1 hypothetical protein AVEN_131016-1 [Araneus ventricosus]GBO22322.1 hypothetical protein AVEN_245350-1 [Araneus ventricosus]GBO22324.1 hypothetical protein AVEN_82231-1 [Araneus ventricosus]
MCITTNFISFPARQSIWLRMKKFQGSRENTYMYPASEKEAVKANVSVKAPTKYMKQSITGHPSRVTLAQTLAAFNLKPYRKSNKDFFIRDIIQHFVKHLRCDRNL